MLNKHQKMNLPSLIHYVCRLFNKIITNIISQQEKESIVNKNIKVLYYENVLMKQKYSLCHGYSTLSKMAIL